MKTAVPKSSLLPFLLSPLPVLALAACQMPMKTVDRSGDSAAPPKVVVETVAANEMRDPVAVPASSPAAAGSSAVLIAYEFQGDTSTLPTGGCRLKLENVRTRKDAFVALKADQMAVIKELEPGRYFGTRLSCGTTRIWNLDNLFGPGFDVVDGKVSYVGKVIFEMSRTDMTGFRQASRVESRNVLREIQDLATGEIVSGFTLKTITPRMWEGDGPEAFDVFAKGTSEPGKTLDGLMSKLKRCSFRAAKDDPLRLGHLNYIAKYKGGAFAEMTEKTDSNSFSENFTTCVDNSLRTFQPPVANDLEVRVAF